MATRWYRWEERQITGNNDEFLVRELEEKIEDWLFPRLRAITIDDNEFRKYGSIIWDNVTKLELAVSSRRKRSWIDRLVSISRAVFGR